MKKLIIFITITLITLIGIIGFEKSSIIPSQFSLIDRRENINSYIQFDRYTSTFIFNDYENYLTEDISYKILYDLKEIKEITNNEYIKGNKQNLITIEIYGKMETITKGKEENNLICEVIVHENFYNNWDFASLHNIKHEECYDYLFFKSIPMSLKKKIDDKNLNIRYFKEDYYE